MQSSWALTPFWGGLPGERERFMYKDRDMYPDNARYNVTNREQPPLLGPSRCDSYPLG